jgi:uncharacterized protein YegL
MREMKKTTAQFADTYEGCQVVANLMGLNEETVRKRVKADKIPAIKNAKGTWVFTHATLAAAGIEPFKTFSSPPAVIGALPGVTSVKRNVTDVFFVLDRSGSMQGLEKRVSDSLNEQAGELTKASGPNDVYNVWIINFDTEIDVSVRGVLVTAIGRAGDFYLRPRGGTALWDAIGEAISLSRVADDGTHAVLVSVLTDGENNASKKVSQETLAATIKSLTATDRYTFTYAGPAGSQHVARDLNIPVGNITTWDGTSAGLTTLSASTRSSLNSYATNRAAGVMKSTSFYAQPTVTDASKFAKQLDNKLDDVTHRVEVERVTDRDPRKIKDFSIAKFGGFTPGTLFYELIEGEDVQDHKQIIVQDKTAGQFFTGWLSAKRLLGLPDFKGTVTIRPGNLGDFKVFIQSTSFNRNLDPGTAVVKLG